MDPSETERYWRSLIAEQEESGTSIAAWCRKHDVRAQTMYWWRSELRRRAQMAGEPAFVPVEVISLAAEPRESEVRVIAGGREVIVGRGVDEELLARVVLLLERLPC